MFPTYYPSCSWARSAGAPIARGSPGYRPQLDADNAGIACEGFQQD
ncbi:excalibur calcium-binding domain-containing protein [Sphingomonas glaciei]|uniref:Excalibur calcium-binding domain-containing protein n=1 Tax=Sphingomonas glaciei TaxID=2938948 RepID=A0ABY5N2A3_9SPHN|nr:excalibur calcium-binding domain-containing protein [Sphingomonas glaciei]UUR09408.1 excalibur calcium-binding domain-containing protein [Sphingomonas glaciei]